MNFVETSQPQTVGEVWQYYRPLLTEARGVVHVVSGVGFIACGILAKCWLRDSDRSLTGRSITTGIIGMGIDITAIGLAELAIPITAATGYGLYSVWS